VRLGVLPSKANFIGHPGFKVQVKPNELVDPSIYQRQF